MPKEDSKAIRSERMDLPSDRPSQEAFANALDSGRLSLDENAYNYVGDFMYMGPNAKGRATFQHKLTRQYLKDQDPTIVSLFPEPLSGPWSK